MKEKFTIEGKTLKIGDISVNFMFNIQNVKYHDGIYVVLLNIPNGVNENDNIIGLNSRGEKVWKIENPVEAFKLRGDEQGYVYLASRIYVHLYMNPDGNFTATTFSGMKYSFDYKTGKIKKQEWVRW